MLEGLVKMIVREAEQITHETDWEKNLLTDAGRAAIAGLLYGDGGVPAFTAIAIGIGQTPADVLDTDLESEIVSGGGQRRSGANVTKQRITTVVTNDTAEWDTTFTFTASFAVSEAGLLNNGTAGLGDMLSRRTFAILNMSDGKTLQILWRIRQS